VKVSLYLPQDRRRQIRRLFTMFRRFQATMNQYAYVFLFLDFAQFLAVDIVFISWILPAHMNYFAFRYIKLHTLLLGPVKQVIKYQLQLVPFFFCSDFLCSFSIVREWFVVFKIFSFIFYFLLC
jgi:hypothetical protein